VIVVETVAQLGEAHLAVAQTLQDVAVAITPLVRMTETAVIATATTTDETVTAAIVRAVRMTGEHFFAGVPVSV
jgi:hypothetical protein